MSKEFRVVMTGSRSWTDTDVIREALVDALDYFELERTPEKFTLINGTAAGADKMSARIAKELGMTVEDHPAQWNVHSETCPVEPPKNGWCYQGRSKCRIAGFRRNQEMLESGCDLVLAFIHNNSNGASHTVKLAEKMNLETWVYSIND